MSSLSEDFQKFLTGSLDELISLTFQLCAIPAPSHHEQQRAAFCKKWLEDAGLTQVTIDPALNVVWPYRLEEHDGIFLMIAHTDTVFPDTQPFTVRVEGNRAYCPGICDDTVCAATLMMLMKYVHTARPQTEHGLLFSLNSCEEGLGNLKGVRQLMKDYGSRVREFVTLDGDYRSVCTEAVGSTRYLISVDTEGGHSFGAFGNRNAIERLSRIIGRLYAVETPKNGDAKTTYNVGGISGGTSVNTIAQHAEMLYEYRSDSVECLRMMKETFDKIIDISRPECLRLSVEVLGERPCADGVDPQKQTALYERCRHAIHTATGIQAPRRSGSTDCNIPLSMGIPSACFGGYLGAGSHTREEYLELDSLKDGYRAVAELLASYFV